MQRMNMMRQRRAVAGAWRSPTPAAAALAAPIALSSLRSFSCALTRTHIPSSLSNSSFPHFISIQRRSYLWIEMPDDDDVYFGKNRDEEEEEEEEENPTVDNSKNKKNEKKVDRKGKRIEVKVASFKLGDYQQMESERMAEDAPSDMSHDQNGGRLDIQDYLDQESIELSDDDDAYDAREVEYAIDTHGSDEARRMRTVH
jgi:hypothetical protein